MNEEPPGPRPERVVGYGLGMVSASKDPESDSPNSAINRGRDGPRGGPRPARVVRYGVMGWVGEFSSRPDSEFNFGTRVVVQTDRGVELGEPLGAPCGGCELGVPRLRLQEYTKACGPEFCRPQAGRILRTATEQDVNEHTHLNAHVHEDIANCAELADRLGLDMKIITAEHLLGGERIVFYFRSQTRVDFRQLVKELAQGYRTRIEMRQVGARDEARLVGDYEVCGRECCCRNFLKKLRPVNMKMAKLQKSTLDPSKVSGRCGRLRCCLRYEHAGYEELAGRLPRVNSRVETEAGPATVLDRQVLTQLVSVRTDEDQVLTVPFEEIKAFDLPPAAPRPRPKPVPPSTAPQALAPREARPEPPSGRDNERTNEQPGEPPASSRRSRRRRRSKRPPDTSTPTAAETPPSGDERSAKDGPPADSDTRFVADETRPAAPDPRSGSSAPGSGEQSTGDGETPAAGGPSERPRRRRGRRRRGRSSRSRREGDGTAGAGDGGSDG